MEKNYFVHLQYMYVQYNMYNKMYNKMYNTICIMCTFTFYNVRDKYNNELIICNEPIKYLAVFLAHWTQYFTNIV